MACLALGHIWTSSNMISDSLSNSLAEYLSWSWRNR